MISSQLLGERIAALRKRRGRTQAELASCLGLARTTLVAIEKGERRPANEELLKLGEALATSIHDLLRPDYLFATASPRSRLALESPTNRAELSKAVDRLQELGRRYAELEQVNGISRLPSPLELLYIYQVRDDNQRVDSRLAGEHAALTVRNALSLGDSPALGLLERFELEAGVRIFHLEDLPSSIAALFLWGDLLGACIGINSRFPHERRRWSLVHEIGHFLRDREAGDVLLATAPARRDSSELFAESFTRSFLLPSSSVTKHFLDRFRDNGGSFSVADILSLAEFYEVSLQAMALRMEELKLLSEGTYERLTTRKLTPAAARQVLGFEPRIAADSQPKLPARYIDLALDAFEKELISETELADYLEMDRVSARGLYLQQRYYSLDDGSRVELNLGEVVRT